MNAGATSDRVLDGIRRQLFAGEFRPGSRLDPSRFADALHTSVTPVRDALHILVGRGLIEARTGDGFHIPHVSEPGLRDLYAWNAELLRLVLRGWSAVPSKPTRSLSTHDPAERIRFLFDQVARGSANFEHHRCIRANNDLLAAARHAEFAIITSSAHDMDDIEDALHAENKPSLIKLIADYHRRRIGSVPAIVRHMYDQR